MILLSHVLSDTVGKLAAVLLVSRMGSGAIGDEQGPTDNQLSGGYCRRDWRAGEAESEIGIPQYLVSDGKPPTNLRFSVLFFVANYYLLSLDRQ